MKVFGGRVSEAHGRSRNREAKCFWAGSAWIGLILVGLRGWEADPLPWSGPAPWLVGTGGLELQPRGPGSVAWCD